MYKIFLGGLFLFFIFFSNISVAEEPLDLQRQYLQKIAREKMASLAKEAQPALDGNFILSSGHTRRHS